MQVHNISNKAGNFTCTMVGNTCTVLGSFLDLSNFALQLPTLDCPQVSGASLGAA